MADEQENKTGFDTTEDFESDPTVPNSGVGDGVDFEASLPRAISDIKEDVSTPRERDDEEARETGER